jgi:hypothetical protein
MTAAPARVAILRLAGTQAAARRALSVPVSRALAPTASSIPERETLAAQDPRWVFAVRVSARLQGGAAAILAPEDREILVGLARRLGLRPFDASLIIAVVQDAARSGLDPLGVATEDGVSMIRPASAGEALSVRGVMVWSVVLAAAMFAGMVMWVVARP